MPSNDPVERSLLSDTELLDTIRRDLHIIYTDVLRQPLPVPLAAALQRIETRSNFTMANVCRDKPGPAATCLTTSAQLTAPA